MRPTVRIKRAFYCGSLTAALLSLHPLGAYAQDSTRVWVEAIDSPQYFAVLVTDMDRSAEWYRTAFGLADAGGSQADDGSWQIMNLKNQNLFVELIRDDRVQDVDRARGFFKVGFQVPDVGSVADVVDGATGRRPRILEFEEFGVRIIQLHDPDGNTIQLASPLETGEPRN